MFNIFKNNRNTRRYFKEFISSLHKLSHRQFSLFTSSTSKGYIQAQLMPYVVPEHTLNNLSIPEEYWHLPQTIWSYMFVGNLKKKALFWLEIPAVEKLLFCMMLLLHIMFMSLVYFQSFYSLMNIWRK